MRLPRLYPITDPRLSGLSHAQQVRRFAEGGANFIQLRDKWATPKAFYEAALEAMQLARSLKVKIIINDRVDIALAVDADGVHLGQDDLPPSQARALLGEKKILGYSTHDLKQAMVADSMPVDYIAIGPIFQTATKVNPDPVIGLEKLAQVKSQLAKPLVAIGGITLSQAAVVLAAGADSLAVIADLFATGDPAAQVKAYQRLDAEAAT
ncbi:MAG: thiamine phosphate synthase [Acidobacteria bacterium]|nr:thiamine phosphate synthase [Acidobacteriota bacterium]